MAIYECGGMTRPSLKDRARTMKMTAAANYGSDVQDHTEESIAQDSGDGIDSYRFASHKFFRSFVDAAV